NLIKLTLKRKLIYDILSKSSQPMNAEEIYKLLEEKMNLSTIYRTLEIFFNDGLVAKNHLDNKAYYYLNHESHHHFMVCKECNQAFEFDCHLDGLIDEIKDKYGFTVMHHDLNLYGLCKDCQNQ